MLVAGLFSNRRFEKVGALKATGSKTWPRTCVRTATLVVDVWMVLLETTAVSSAEVLRADDEVLATRPSSAMVVEDIVLMVVTWMPPPPASTPTLFYEVTLTRPANPGRRFGTCCRRSGGERAGRGSVYWKR